jgi:thymidylate kinase
VTGRRRGRLVALEGPSGIGKSTVAERLAVRYGWTVVREAYQTLRPRPSLRFRTPRALAAIERRLLGAERRRMRRARDLQDGGTDVLLDTTPFGPATYPSGYAQLDPRYAPVAARLVAAVAEDVRTGRLVIPEQIVYLSASSLLAKQRAAGAARTHPPDLRQRHADVARWERRFYGRLVRSSGGAVIRVEAQGPPDRVAHSIALRLRRELPRLRGIDVARALAVDGSALLAPTPATVKNRARSRRLLRR